MSVTLTESELIALYWWPFPPPEDELGWIYEFDVLRHWIADTTTLASERAVSAHHRMRWVALATGAVISQAVILQQSADALGGDAVQMANRSALGTFVDGLVASPPYCDIPPLPAQGPAVVVGGVVVVIPLPGPQPVPPHWDQEERLSRLDLIGVATRLRAAAGVTTSPALRTELLTASDRLYATAGERL